MGLITYKIYTNTEYYQEQLEQLLQFFIRVYASVAIYFYLSL